MRKVLLTAAASLAAATLFAAPAMAGEGRIELDTGLAYNNDSAVKSSIGGAIGYDVNITPNAFIGVEESIDKVLASGYEVRWGSTGRIGARLPVIGKAYALAGYTYGVGPDGAHVGGGIEHPFGPLYGKVEYRHYFLHDGNRDANQVLFGAGVHF